MMKRFLLALPIASILFFAGCNETSQTSTGYTRPQAAAPAATAPQQQTYTGRQTTTQSLPAGWGYIHEQDLNGGRLVVNNAPAPSAQATASSSGS